MDSTANGPPPLDPPTVEEVTRDGYAVITDGDTGDTLEVYPVTITENTEHGTRPSKEDNRILGALGVLYDMDADIDEDTEAGQACAAVVTAVTLLPTEPDWDGNLDDLLRQWDTLDEAEGMLKARIRDWALAAGSMLTDYQAESKGTDHEYKPRVGYDFGGREPVHHAQTPKEKWNGGAVLDQLVRPMINQETGEMCAAVSRDVLDDVLPAVGPDKTSSKWRSRKLTEHGVNLRQVRSRDFDDPTVRLGTKP